MSAVAASAVKGAAKSAAAGAASTAKGRAAALRRGGASRARTERELRAEFGGTHDETKSLIDSVDDELPAGGSDPDAPPAGSNGPRSSSRPSAPRTVVGVANTGGGMILGAFAYVLALTYLRDGKAGVKRWLSAKFLNRTTAGPAS